MGPEPGKAYPDTQFPLDAVEGLSRRGIPDLNQALPSPNPTIATLAALSHKLGGIVLVGHSQTGHFPLEVALRQDSNLSAMVLVEPGGVRSEAYSDDQVAKLATVPLLVIFGDHLDTPTGLPGPGWPARMQENRKLVARLQAAGGHATIIELPEHGLYGNTHFMMYDRNNLQVADILLSWIDKHTKAAIGQ